MNQEPDWLQPVVVCRPALPMDTADVMELTRNIWGGGDYVPYVWQDWLADLQGLLVVAQYGKRVVGLGKLSLLEPGQWFLEGLRVHPDYQGRGFASHIHEYLTSSWEQNCSGTLRLITNSKRLPVQHLCARTGFTRRAELSHFAAPAIPEPPQHLRPVGAGEAGRAFVQLCQAEMSISGGLADRGWEWIEPTEEYLRLAVERQRAWWWSGEHGVLVLGVDEYAEEDEAPLYIQAAACAKAELAGLLVDARRVAAGMAFDPLRCVARLEPDVLKALDAAGFERIHEQSILLYEKRD